MLNENNSKNITNNSTILVNFRQRGGNKPKLTIKYQNIRGFGAREEKFKKKIKKIEEDLSDNVDIFCVAETWYQQINKINKHKFFAASTPEPILLKGRAGDDGLAVFTRPELKKYTKIIQNNPFYLIIKIKKLHILFMYLPPRLNTGEITAIFESIKTRIDLMLGDLNIPILTPLGNQSNSLK